ncbi:MAG: hypothetical protein KF720_09870 [Rubrivivax sp.]|nr:hypothetical protein [Rubrivivax sp.]
MTDNLPGDPSAQFDPETRARLDERGRHWRRVLADELGEAQAASMWDGLARHAVRFRQAVPESFAASLPALSAKAGDALTRLAVARALLAAPRPELPVVLPDAVRVFWARECHRIAQRLLVAGQDADLRADSWRKELLIASGRLLPVGAGFVDFEAGVPRSYLLRGGVSQFLQGLRALTSAGGREPFLELHAHTESISGFSPDGWLASFRILAEMLRLNPHLRGVTRANWFIDPQIASISPHLVYTREVPAAHGATFLFVSHDTDGTSGALARSPTRRAMFERGEYVPQIHMMIWPRKALIEAFGR